MSGASRWWRGAYRRRAGSDDGQLFSHLTDVVRANRSTLDKHIDDSLRAFWGAPVDHPDHARHAMDAPQGQAGAAAKDPLRAGSAVLR